MLIGLHTDEDGHILVFVVPYVRLFHHIWEKGTSKAKCAESNKTPIKLKKLIWASLSIMSGFLAMAKGGSILTDLFIPSEYGGFCLL